LLRASSRESRPIDARRRGAKGGPSVSSPPRPSPAAARRATWTATPAASTTAPATASRTATNTAAAPTATHTPAPRPTVTVTPALTAPATATPTLVPCAGDCDGNHVVSIDELIAGVGIALGDEPPSTCPAMQGSTGQIDIAQLIKAVHNALVGCGDAA
jgi:hypothetical protein